MDLDLLREFYGLEIRVSANLRTPGMQRAFTNVRRERFLGPGPWLIGAPGGAAPEYWETEDADPAHVYHNVVIAIDPKRNLNNGQPAAVGLWIDALGLEPGDRALHVGCGTGYYSAIIADVVGAGGHVWAAEVDPELAERSRQNLHDISYVEVHCADGWEFDPGIMDAIFINAGATHPNRRWLERLAPHGRLVVPLTFTMPGAPHGTGIVLKITRTDQGYDARFISMVGIFSLTSGRDEDWNQRLLKAIQKRQWAEVRSIRLDEHEPDETCFCHGPGLCVSKRANGAAPTPPDGAPPQP